MNACNYYVIKVDEQQKILCRIFSYHTWSIGTLSANNNVELQLTFTTAMDYAFFIIFQA